jgi:ferredoxin-NADP reductase
LPQRGHVSNYNVRLKKKEEVAEGTMAFHFEKPAGFQIKSGQLADLPLLNPTETDAEGNIRSFSITSAPKGDILSPSIDFGLELAIAQVVEN